MKKLNDIRVGILQIPITRIALLVLSDCFAVLMASVLSLYVRYDFHFMEVPREFWNVIIKLYIPNLLIVFLVFTIFRLYNSVWRYASDTELVNNAVAVVICSIMQPVLIWLMDAFLPQSYAFYYGFFLLVFTCGVRFSYRIVRALQHTRLLTKKGSNRVNCMIVGAGAAGNAILKEIETSNYINMHVACAIDDNPGCQGKYLRGVPIVGGRDAILENVEKYSIDEIIIAIPSASRTSIKPILEICKESGAH